MTDKPRVSLALGSGGARGYAHIGIIEELLERGYEVVGIAGTSMGALVGGVHATGNLGEYSDWARGLTQRDVLRLLDPSLRTPGALRGEKIMAEVRQLVGDTRIEDLPIPFTAVATDLVTHREVWFQRGRLDVSIRASIALPSVFTPVVLNGRLLVDGGMLNPVPIAPLSALPADLTIAVDLSGPPAAEGQPGRPRPGRSVRAGVAEAEASDAAQRMPQWRQKLTDRLEEIRETDAVRTLAGWFEKADEQGPEPSEDYGDADEFGSLPPGLGYRDVMTMSYEAMQEVIARYRAASYPADLTISVPRDAAHTLDFHRGAELIDLGHALAARALDDAGR